MKKETFSNVNYKIVSSTNTYKEVLCTYTSNNRKFYRFYQIDIRNGARDSYYLNAAKDKFNEQNEVVDANDSLYPSNSKGKKVAVFAISLGAAAVIALAVALPLTLLKGGSFTDQEKVNTVLDSAIEKVDAFNKTLAIINTSEEPEKNKLNAYNFSNNQEIRTEYYDIAQHQSYINTAITEQQFGLYIFNNIYYCFRHILPDNNLPIGSVITGTTTRMPDPTLQQMWDTMDLPATTLSAKLELEEDGVAFQADWDFRSEKLEQQIPAYAMYSMVIMTNGKIFYDFSTNTIKRINLNYYWTDPHRIFSSFNYNYETNEFNLLYAYLYRGVAHDWSYDATDKKLADEWNDGSLSYEKLITHNYNSCYTATGNIADKIEDLNFSGYFRASGSKTSRGDVIVEPTDNPNVAKFKDMYEKNYQINKDVKLRTESDLLNLSGAHKVSIDDCVRCGEARTKIYWLYKYVENYGYQYEKPLLPFLKKEELTSYVDKMIANPGTLSAEQIALLNKAKQYLTSISEGKYFGQIIAKDNAGFTYDYEVDIQGFDRYNVFSVYYFAYVITDSTNPNIKVSFSIENNEPIIGGCYGEKRKTIAITYATPLVYAEGIIAHPNYPLPTEAKFASSTEIRVLLYVDPFSSKDHFPIAVYTISSDPTTPQYTDGFCSHGQVSGLYDVGIVIYPRIKGDYTINVRGITFMPTQSI